MVRITEEELVIFIFPQVSAHQAGEVIDKLLYFGVLEPGDQGLQKFFPAEKLQKKGQGSFIHGPVQPEADFIGGYMGGGHVHAPPRNFHQTFRVRGPSYSQKKIRCQVPSRIVPSSTRTVTELPVMVAIRWEGELPSLCR